MGVENYLAVWVISGSIIALYFLIDHYLRVWEEHELNKERVEDTETDGWD